MRRHRLDELLILVPLLIGLSAAAAAGAALDRSVLPIPEPKRPLYSELDVRDATPPPRFEVKAPEGAPNVLIVLIDDLGFAGTSTFGGPVGTPTFDRLANEGLYYNNFHTTAVCSPTRAALKSGRNHHVANMGGIIETGTAFPGKHRADTEQRRARSPRCCASTATAPAPSASGTRPPPGRRVSRVRSTAGRPIRASTSSTASSAARPTSGRRTSTTASIRSSCRRIRTTTS